MEYNDDKTIIAPATIAGTGAITIIRISGPEAISLTDRIVKFAHSTAADSKPGSVKFGTVEYEGETLDEVLVNIYRAPKSYTGEDSSEIMCHASAYITSRILEIALENGARLAGPGEFTRRAFLNGKMDLAQAEAVADVIASSTSSAHRIAMQQLKGRFSSELAQLRDEMLNMASLMELELDFSEEEVEFADRKRLEALLEETDAKIVQLKDSFRLGNAIKTGIPVAIAGAPNSGKSTLLNAILGDDRAIVSDIPGTTRDTIEESFNAGGILFRFVDTAGIRDDENVDVIEKTGIRRSFESIRTADVVIFLLDAVTLSDSLSKEPGSISGFLDPVLSAVDFTSQKLFVTLNKLDKITDSGKNGADLADNIFVNIKNHIVSYTENQYGKSNTSILTPEYLKIAAINKTGVSELVNSISEYEKQRLSKGGENGILVSNARHYEALVTAHENIACLKSNLKSGTSTELLAEDLRGAISALGEITGEITPSAILSNIFSKFCIGK